MSDFYGNHFGKIPHGWFDENQFINRITRADKWILACLASYIWRSEKIDTDYEIDRELVRLYKENGLLVTLMSERTLARKCDLNRSTVYEAIGRFDDVGAVIRLSGKKGKGFSNVYIMGLQRMTLEKNGRIRKMDEYLFSDSPVLRAGGRIPDDVKDFIRANFSKRCEVLRKTKLAGYNELIFPLIFNNDSPLIPDRTENAEMEETIVRDLGGYNESTR